MDNRPIGIFDSGLGGLTGLKAFCELLPEEDIVYFADSGRVPYGEKSPEQLRRMAMQDLGFLSAFGVKAILVACGTLSSNAGDLLASWSVPTFGVLQSSVDWMSRLDGDGPIAVAATAATIRSGAFQQALQNACPGREVLSLPCPEFVPLIESGHVNPDDPSLIAAVGDALSPARDAHAEALLLGCTHYGIISSAIAGFLGPDVKIVSAAESGAVALSSYLLKNRMTGGHGGIRYYTSGDAGGFSGAASLFLGCSASDIRAESVPVQAI